MDTRKINEVWHAYPRNSHGEFLGQDTRTTCIDATSPTFMGVLTGGGTVKCPAFYNGTSWVAG